MIVDDFDIAWASFAPYETDAPLVIDPDAVLAAAGASKRFETVARMHPHV